MDKADALREELRTCREVEPTDESPEDRIHILSPRELKRLARYRSEQGGAGIPLHEPRAFEQAESGTYLKPAIGYCVVHYPACLREISAE